MARRVAERLAAGQLQERVQVTGEDDLARLATSFNQMASNLQRQIRQLEELSRVQQQFVSDVSHELRTPLTTVRMAGDVLHDARRSLRPRDVARGRAAADRARPVRDAAGRPARDQPLRRRRRRARPRRGQPGRRRPPGRRPDPGAGRPARHPASWSTRPTTPCLAEADVRRVERIVRNLVTNAIDHAETPRRRGPRRRRRPGRRDRRPRLRRRAAARGVGDGLQPLLAGRPRPGPHQRRHRPRAVDLARGHPPARRLAAGLGAARRGRPVPADPAAARRRRRCGRARCRWSPPTPRRWSRERADAGPSPACRRCWRCSPPRPASALPDGPVPSCPADDRCAPSPTPTCELRAAAARRRATRRQVDRERLPARDDGLPGPHRRGRASSSPATPGAPGSPSSRSSSTRAAAAPRRAAWSRSTSSARTGSTAAATWRGAARRAGDIRLRFPMVAGGRRVADRRGARTR